MRPVREEKDLEFSWDQKAALYGEYRKMLLPRSKRPGSEMIETGRIEIRVGKSIIALEVQNKGYRPEEEKKLFTGKRVKVIGTLHRWIQLWGSPEEQAIVMPAIVDIESIEFAALNQPEGEK